MYVMLLLGVGKAMNLFNASLLTRDNKRLMSGDKIANIIIRCINNKTNLTLLSIDSFFGQLENIE